MAEYSQYGGASAELTQLLAEIQKPALPPSINDMKMAINLGREAVAKEAMKTLGLHVTLQNHGIPARDGYTIEARSYRSSAKPLNEKLPIFVYYHGGGFLLGTLNTEDATCSRIAANVDCVVLSINYRHTPEYTFPIAWNDSEDAFEWAYANGEQLGGDISRIVVGGVSAGGQLAASLVQTKKRENSTSYASIKGQVLMIPGLVAEDQHKKLYAQLKDPNLSSWTENEFAPLLPVSRMRMFTQLLFPDGGSRGADPRMNPGMATPEEVSDLPPVTLGIAGLDPLRDEALLYAQFLVTNGVPTKTYLFKGVPHGFRRFGEKLSSASKHWDEVMQNGITWALSGPRFEKPEVEVLT